MERQQTTTSTAQQPQKQSTLVGRQVMPLSCPHRQMLQLQRSIGNRAVGRFIQAKLTIGAPGDKYEQEADHVAETVMRMPEPPIVRPGEDDEKKIQRKPLFERITPLVQRQVAEDEEETLQRESLFETNAPVIQRVPLAVREDDEEKKVQTQSANGHANAVPSSVEANINAMKGGGSPLPEPTRNFFESRFGTDFSSVRLHTDSRAAETAQSINARAFTIGSDITFGTGQYSPDSSSGKNLLAHELTHTIQQNGTAGNLRTDVRLVQFYKGSQRLLQREGNLAEEAISSTSLGTNKVGFVREEGLNLREESDQKTKSLATLKFGQRVHVLDDSQPGWLKVAVLGQTGYVFKPRVLFPPEDIIQKDPGLRLIKVKPGQTFWGLVKEVYRIQGNESTKDQNINHFINAIRAVNKPEAFKIKTDTLDKIGNATIPGRDASDTYLVAGVDLWIPSFGVAAKMNVGSGTVRGEITRLIKNIEQKLSDFKEAAWLSRNYIWDAIKKHVGEMAEGLIDGLIDFAKDAAKILAISTAVGAIIGAFFGGVGALPGAEIGFEIGLLILEYYGLYMLIEAIFGVAAGLLSALGDFISLVWTANGDREQLKKAGMKLADALGILVSAVLVVLVAYLLKKGADFIKETKFGKTVGEKRLAKWLKERQNQTTIKEKWKSLKEELGKGSKPALSRGELYEKQIKDRFRKKIIRENEILKDATDKVIGEIDFETAEAIVETGTSLGDKLPQLHKLAEVAKQRAKRLDVIYDPLDTPPGRLDAFRESLGKKWGNRVRFIPINLVEP